MLYLHSNDVISCVRITSLHCSGVDLLLKLFDAFPRHTGHHGDAKREGGREGGEGGREGEREGGGSEWRGKESLLGNAWVAIFVIELYNSLPEVLLEF